MTDPSARAPAAARRLLTFWSGGWVLLLAGILSGALLVWGLVGLLLRESVPQTGDGRNVATYGFDLSNLLVPRDTLVAAGFAKDGLPAITMPRVLTVAGADQLTQELREQHLGKFLVDTDRVLGVTLNGESRAYPVRFITWHEIVNDVVGGVPIAVTFNPLSYGVVVFERRVGGETLEFGVSGLLYNSNLVMYDRRPGGRGESLWSQLQFRAIAGPAAARGARLEVLPVQMAHWRDWRGAHPETTVVPPDMERFKIYKRTYAEYYGSTKLRFPVAPLPPENGPALKEPVVAVRTAGAWRTFTWAQIQGQVDDSGVWRTRLDGQPVRFVFRHEPKLVNDPAVVWVEADGPGQSPQVAYAFWFAWHALHSDVQQ